MSIDVVRLELEQPREDRAALRGLGLLQDLLHLLARLREAHHLAYPSPIFFFTADGMTLSSTVPAA